MTFIQDTIKSLYTLIQGQKPHSPVYTENSNGKKLAFGLQTAPGIFLNLMFKLFFKYLDKFLVYWMDKLLIYSQTEVEHQKYLELIFEKIRDMGIN